MNEPAFTEGATPKEKDIEENEYKISARRAYKEASQWRLEYIKKRRSDRVEREKV